MEEGCGFLLTADVQIYKMSYAAYDDAQVKQMYETSTCKEATLCRVSRQTMSNLVRLANGRGQ